MASAKKIAEVLSAIKTVYPYYVKGNTEDDNITLAKTWNMLLSEYTDEAVDVAIIKCLQTCTMPPTPADVIKHIKAMRDTLGPTDEELWDCYTNALRKTANQIYCFEYTFVEANGKTQGENARARVNDIWNALPDRLKQYIATKSELIRMARNYSDEDLKFEKQRFMKIMQTIKSREEYAGLMLKLESQGATMLEG